MLALSPKPRAPRALLSSRYRQTAVHSHFNSFNRCKSLKQIFARNLFSETPKQTPTEREHRRNCRFRCRITITLLLARGSGRTVNCDSDAIPCECEYYGQFAMLLHIIVNADPLFKRGHYAHSETYPLDRRTLSRLISVLACGSSRSTSLFEI